MVSGENPSLVLENVNVFHLTFWGRTSSAWIGAMYLPSNVGLGLVCESWTVRSAFVHRKHLFNNATESKETWEEDSFNTGKDSTCMWSDFCSLSVSICFENSLIYWGFSSLKGSTNENSLMPGQRKRVRTTVVRFFRVQLENWKVTCVWIADVDRGWDTEANRRSSKIWSGQLE